MCGRSERVFLFEENVVEAVTSPIAGPEPAPAQEAPQAVARKFAPKAEHACRNPDFNAMVDTCPACEWSSTEAFLKYRFFKGL
jgi:hypothetical protein